jgi:hypothetical protein
MTDAEILEGIERYGLSLCLDPDQGGRWGAGPEGRPLWAASTAREALELAIRHCRYEDDPLGRYGPTPQEKMQDMGFVPMTPIAKEADRCSS